MNSAHLLNGIGRGSDNASYVVKLKINKLCV